MNEYPNSNDTFPYSGGVPVQCPRCKAVVSTRFCCQCGLDLSTVYNVFEGRVMPKNSIPAFNPYTGAPVYPPAAPYGQAIPHKKNSKALWITLACVLFAVVFALFSFFLNFSSAPANINEKSEYQSTFGASHPEGVSLNEYRQLKAGMSYARISAIIGGDGKEVSSGKDVDGTSYVIYGWYGENNSDARIYITFSKDVATNITNEGLTNE